MDGTPIEVLEEDGALLQTITLTWRGGSPVVRRTLPGAGWVSDRFLRGAGGTLAVVRTAAMRNVRGREVEGTRAVELTYVVLTVGRREPGAGAEVVIDEERWFCSPVRRAGQGVEEGTPADRANRESSPASMGSPAGSLSSCRPRSCSWYGDGQSVESTFSELAHPR